MCYPVHESVSSIPLGIIRDEILCLLWRLTIARVTVVERTSLARYQTIDGVGINVFVQIQPGTAQKEPI